MSYAPTITTYANRQPAPRAEVLFSGFAPGTVTVTVWREARGRQYRVRGAVNVVTTGALTRIDNEIPFNVPVAYWAEMFDSAGTSLGLTDRSVATLWCSETWLHNPLNPQGAIHARFAQGAGSDMVRPVGGNVYYPQGRTVGVVISSGRSGLAGVPLDIIVNSVPDADRFQAMLGGYDDNETLPPVLCIRAGSQDQIRLPSPFYAAVLSAREIDVTYRYGESGFVFEMKGDEVSPPAEGIAVPLLRRADINAWYQTRAAMNTDPANPNRLAVNRRYDLSGTAAS